MSVMAVNIQFSSPSIVLLSFNAPGILHDIEKSYNRLLITGLWDIEPFGGTFILALNFVFLIQIIVSKSMFKLNLLYSEVDFLTGWFVYSLSVLGKIYMVFLFLGG